MHEVVTTDSLGSKAPSPTGLFTFYDGLDMCQTCDHIEILVSSQREFSEEKVRAGSDVDGPGDCPLWSGRGRWGGTWARTPLGVEGADSVPSGDLAT